MPPVRDGMCPDRRQNRLSLVVVCGLSSHLDFSVGLIEELLGLDGMAVHVEFIGTLGSAHAVDGLLNEALGCIRWRRVL